MREPHPRRPELAQMLRDLLRLRATHGEGLAHLAHSFSLHVITGVLAVAAHYATMYGLLAAHLDPLAASTAGFFVGAVTRFTLSFFRVFAPTRSLRGASARFAIAIGLQAGANTLLLALLLAGGMTVWPAQVLTTVVLAFATYTVYRLWVFR